MELSRGVSPDIKTILDRLYSSRSNGALANDPLSFCHRFSDPADQEVVALIASSFAYGSVSIILRTLESVFAEIGRSPRRYVENLDPRKTLRSFSGFKHRFNDGRDLCALLWAARLMIEDAGSINDFFLRYHKPDTEDIGPALDGYTAAVLALEYQPVFGGSGIPPDSYFPFFFPAPSAKSACKRLCMFLRWTVRPADGVDLGIWKGVFPAQLVIPVDTHIARICGYLGFTRRRTADWLMARQISSALRLFDANDPIKYDFSLCHLGISGECDGKNNTICQSCSLAQFCSRPR